MVASPAAATTEWWGGPTDPVYEPGEGELPLGVRRAAKTPVSMTAGPRCQKSCVEHSSDQEAVLILREVIHENVLVGRQGACSNENVAPASLPGSAPESPAFVLPALSSPTSVLPRSAVAVSRAVRRLIRRDL